MDALSHLVPNRTALIVVDMQNGFCSPGGSTAKLGLSIERTGRTVIPIRRLIDAFHAAGAPVMYTKLVLRPDYADAGLLTSRFPALHSFGHMVDGSWDAAIVGDLRPADTDFVIRKRRFDSFYDTELELTLRCQGVETLVIAGVPTNISVDSTARAAFTRDYEVIIPRDATASYSEEMETASLLTLGFMFAHVAPVGAVIAALDGGVADRELASEQREEEELAVEAVEAVDVDVDEPIGT